MVLLNQVDRVNRSFLLHVYIWSYGSFFLRILTLTLLLRYYLSDFYQSFRERCNFFVNVMMIDLLQDFLDPHLSN